MLGPVSGWGLVVAIHLLAATIWVGGMFFMLFVLRPSLGILDDTGRMGLLTQVMRRFFAVVWVAVITMLVTGYAMLFGVYGGPANAPWAINIMQLLGLAMGGIFGFLYFVPWQQFLASQQKLALERIRNLVLLNLAIGALTICLGGLSSFAPG